MARRLTKNNGIKFCTAVATLLISQQAFAAAFALKEQSTTYLGNAFAGTASTSEDASSNWYNPAGLTQLKHSQVVASVIYIDPRTKLNNATATFFGAPVTGQNPAYATGNEVIPGFHAAWRINHRLAFGFSIVAPYGLSTKYTGDSIARFIATTSKITTIDFTPSLAYLINEKFAIGAGFDPTRVIATLDADIAFGGFPGYVNNNGTGWGYGFHVGGLYKPTECTKMGLTYFSRITPHLKGGVSVLNLPGAQPVTFTSKVDFPDRLVYSITHDYNQHWSFMADVEWTHWSVGKYLQLDYNVGTPARIDTYFKNTWRFALGTDYNYSKCLTFKGGLSYEQTPVQYTYRSASLPDANRYWVAVGAKYKYKDVLALDVAYAHLFFVDAPIGLRTTVGRTLFGTYRTSANLIGAQITWSFM